MMHLLDPVSIMILAQSPFIFLTRHDVLHWLPCYYSTCLNTMPVLVFFSKVVQKIMIPVQSPLFSQNGVVHWLSC
jgi:hypothetical protein